VSLTPNDLGRISERLMMLSRALDEQTDALEVLDRQAVETRHAYEIAFAGAFLKAEGAMDVRKQKSVLSTDSEKFAAEIAEAKLRACRARISTIKVQIDTGRSLGAALKAEMAFAGNGFTP
jgi:hypothetical protein